MPEKIAVKPQGPVVEKEEIGNSLSALVEAGFSDRHPAAETSFSRPVVGVISQNVFHSTHP